MIAASLVDQLREVLYTQLPPALQREVQEANGLIRVTHPLVRGARWVTRMAWECEYAECGWSRTEDPA